MDQLDLLNYIFPELTDLLNLLSSNCLNNKDSE